MLLNEPLYQAIERQREREMEAYREAQEQTWDMFVNQGEWADGIAGAAVLRAGFVELRDTVATMAEAYKAGAVKSREADMAKRIFESVSAEQAAIIAIYSTITKLLTNQGRGDNSHTASELTIATAIGRALEKQAAVERWKGEDRADYMKFVRTVRNITPRHVTAWLNERPQFKETAHVETVQRLGLRLVALVRECCPNIFQPVPKMRKKAKALMFAPEVGEFVSGLVDHAASLMMSDNLMVCPPTPWERDENGRIDGGYIVPQIYAPRQGIERGYQPNSFANRITDRQLEVLNTLGQTAWCINPFIKDLLEQTVAAGERLHGVMPEIYTVPLPSLIPDDEWKKLTYEQRDQLKAEREQIHAHNAKATCRGVLHRILMRLANDMEGEAFWMPWGVDWRGRAYPLSSILQPQGEDMVRALLQFDEGKTLGDKGYYWLAIHIANCMGQDKLPLMERVKWTEDHADQIRASVANPRIEDWWAQGDDPLQALAAMNEMVLAWDHGWDAVVSHIPVGIDGSCNGIQHLAALARDEEGGEAVNLLPSPERQDIYQRVADRVNAMLQAKPYDDGFARKWLEVGVTRKTVKRAVMTTPYGVTHIGVKDQLLKDGFVRSEDWGDGTWKAAKYLGDLIMDATASVTENASAVKDWLSECVKIITSQHRSVSWTTPYGNVVTQDYPATVKSKLEVVWTRVTAGRVPLSLLGTARADRPGQAKDRHDIIHFKDAPNRQKNVGAIVPNYIHSFDAAHMMRVVERMAEKGHTSFAMVHDSYAMHACDVFDLAYETRRQFVDMYLAADWLAATREEWMLSYQVDLPEPPKPGNLDIKSVLDSEFFFA